MLTGCTGAPPAPPQPAPSAPSRTLTEAKGPGEFTLPELLTALTAYLNADPAEPARAKLAALFERWWGGMKPERTPDMLTDDLNGDGSPEVVTAIGGFKAAEGESPWVMLVVSGKPGAYRVDHVVPKLAPVREGFLYRATLVAQPNLTPDQAVELVWLLQTVVGATGGRGWAVTVSWYPGLLKELEPAIHMPNPTAARVENQELVISGGLSGGAAAAAMQRLRTDRYVWARGRWQLADRQFAPSAYGYHRLIDGIVAESLGKLAEAEVAYREAAEPTRAAIDEPKKLKEPEKLEQFAGAVRTLARVRLAALSAGGGCQPVESAALADALNLPGGLGNPVWTATNLCGPVSFPDLE